MIGCCPLWYYQNAVACASNLNSAVVGGACWWPTSQQNAKGLETTFINTTLYFPIPFLPGTIIDKFSLKFLSSSATAMANLKFHVRSEDSNIPDYVEVWHQYNLVALTEERQEFNITPYELELERSYIFSITGNLSQGDKLTVYTFGIHTTRRYL